ncbi:putative membrane protein [Devosia subaequoris]|uniref:Putative membrane protein n=1 Tax=Devosia subaequoris TaxID=395930 RepID=A0A7W6IJG5_9HYPH|nr:SdpI family protein [Devosia subaequoris]MBB4050760.1 putative membrane protein [Devosia subaequoris]MCP1208560.1 SdpI family protein [Devosia subaequoris]
MPSLVTRFHILILIVTLAIAGVAVLNIPEGYAFPAHWRGSTVDWLWPRNLALAVAPSLQLFLLVAFFLLGRALTKNQLAKTRHILDPALSLLLAVAAACQLGLLLSGIGSDIDMFRITAFGLAAILLVLAVVIYEAERHSYAGLRMPWPIPSDRAWKVVHRVSGIASGLAAIALAWLAWTDPGSGTLVVTMAGILGTLPLLAGLATLTTRSMQD